MSLDDASDDPDPFDLSSIDRFLDEQRLLLRWADIVDWPEPVEAPELPAPADDQWEW